MAKNFSQIKSNVKYSQCFFLKKQSFYFKYMSIERFLSRSMVFKILHENILVVVKFVFYFQ